VEVLVGEVIVHLLLRLLGSMAYLDPLLPPPHLPSPARICHQDTLMILAWGFYCGRVRFVRVLLLPVQLKSVDPYYLNLHPSLPLIVWCNLV
jgi:hypothetical protein